MTGVPSDLRRDLRPRLTAEFLRLLDNVFFWALMSALVGPIAGTLPEECIRGDVAALIFDNRYIAILACWVMVFVTAVRFRSRR